MLSFSDEQGILKTKVGKKIASLVLKNKDYSKPDTLRFTFDDGSGITLCDNARLCCETRYMRTDDDLSYYVGAEFLGFDIKYVQEEVFGEGWECGKHDVQFLVVKTSKGEFTMSNHNEHNGYYEGFFLCISPI